MNEIQELEPKLIWHYFNEILGIPRPSKKEKKILAYLQNFAEKKQLKWKQDKVGNLLITKNAAEGVDLETVVLQSHVDMVCEKNQSVKFNFLTDRIDAYIDDGWVKARGTTLGADNGIGIAAQLAILADDTIKHGPLECLFTVDEETGLTGAFNLEPGFFKGKYLINLDSEDDGEIFIGCAGGVDTLISLPIEYKKLPADQIAYTLKIEGLQGGHSGDDINKNRGNAIKYLVRFLILVSDHITLHITELNGGNLRNAIPREASALISIQEADNELFLKLYEQYKGRLEDENQLNEPDLQFICKKDVLQFEAIKPERIRDILTAIHASPNGVIEMSDNIEQLVQTSTNLASVKTTKKSIEIVTSQRSSVESAKLHIARRIRAAYELVGGTVTNSESYPGWNPNADSQLLQITTAKHRELFSEEPLVRAIHAGLECGLFLKKYPYLDMVSIGPTIKGAHSPSERLEIKTVDKFWKLLTSVLESIPSK